MKTIIAFATFMCIVLAAPSLKPASLVLHYDKATSESDIKILDAGTTNILGHSCGTSIITGAFEGFPVTVSIDLEGRGNITIGTKGYIVHSLPEFSGGIVCNRGWDSEEVNVDCAIEVPISIDSSSSETPSCFAKRELQAQAAAAAAEVALNPEPEDTTPNPVATALVKRQNCLVTHRRTVRVGNGDPHQHYYRRQISENIYCGAVTCNVGKEDVVGYSIGFSASVTPFEWISAGFEVQKSWSSGTSYGCGAGKGEKVCLWYATAFTLYKVKNTWMTCDNSRETSTYNMKSPNKNNKGGKYMCYTGSWCKNIHYHNWKAGRAGKP